MRIIIQGRDIAPEVQQCEDRDEVGVLFEEYRIASPVGEESVEHRQQMNSKLLEVMLRVHSGDVTEGEEPFNYV